jgi:hypothetical protein
LHFIENGTFRVALQESPGIFPDEVSKGKIFQIYVGFTGKKVLAEGRLSRLPGSRYRDYGILLGPLKEFFS